MKPTDLKKNGTLSLKKTTIARLSENQLMQVNGGANQVTTNNGGIPESCGYACGDCMSTMNTTITRPPQTIISA